MSYYTLRQVVEHAREKSPFYRELYSKVPKNWSDISELPIIDQEAFWNANQFPDNKVITCPLADGVILNSGGTSGRPKRSFFTHEEQKVKIHEIGLGCDGGILERGDRVGNMMAAGSMYPSFISMQGAMAASPVGLLVLPICHNTPFPQVIDFMREFSINALAYKPTSLMGFISYVEQNKIQGLSLNKILYGGEPLYPDQRKRILSLFPNCKISAIAYLSTDGGVLGYADKECAENEYKIRTTSSIVEIVDENGQPIREPGISGRIISTSLIRLAVPGIRYPIGDMGRWLPSKGNIPKLELLGRAPEGVRVGAVPVFMDDIRSIFSSLPARFEILNFQMQLLRVDSWEQLCLRIAVKDPKAFNASDTETVKAAIFSAMPLFKVCTPDPLKIDWIRTDDLICNPTTGKMVLVIDKEARK